MCSARLCRVLPIVWLLAGCTDASGPSTHRASPTPADRIAEPPSSSTPAAPPAPPSPPELAPPSTPAPPPAAEPERRAPELPKGPARELHPLGGSEECLEMYTVCDDRGACTSAPFTIDCGETTPNHDRTELLRCVCP